MAAPPCQIQPTPVRRHRWRAPAWVGLASLLLALILWSAPARAQDATPAQAGSADTAGLVIIDGAGATQTYCIAMDEGATGWDLLVDSGVAVNSEPSAMGASICSINGTGCNSPRQSCFCQCQGSPCVYWSFWEQDEDGAWVYSNQGASNAKVHPGEVQAWVWGDGTSGKAPAPPALTIGDICLASAAPSVGDAVSSNTVSSTQSITESVTQPVLTTLAPSVQTSTPEAATTTASFPWTTLIVLLPLPIILIVMLFRRQAK